MKRLEPGHRTRDFKELSEAKNRLKLKKSVFANKKQFRDLFNDFMAPRPTDQSWNLNGDLPKQL